MYAVVVERSQRARRGRLGFYGPDRYVVVVIAESREQAEQAASKPLSERNRVKFRTTLLRCGEGYAVHIGPRSGLGQSRMRAERAAAVIRDGGTIVAALAALREVPHAKG